MPAAVNANIPHELDQERETADALEAIGKRIRILRTARGLTLQELADQTKLSQSMMSVVERGRASPSISTLLAIGRALNVSIQQLLMETTPTDDPVVRFAELPVIETPDHVLRRVLYDNRRQGVFMTYNEYRPMTGNSPTPIEHGGHEFGFILEGELTVEVDGRSYLLGQGDLVSFKSSRPHRMWNYSNKLARATWFNISAGLPD